MSDVIVVGAGPTGLTLAVDLVRRGLDVDLLEAEPELHKHSRGKGLQPRTLEVFDDLGVIEPVLEVGEWQQDITINVDQSRLARLPAGLAEPRPDVPYPNIVMIPQWRTTRILAERLSELGGRIRFGMRLESFTADAYGVRATAIGPKGERDELTASYLVGCDGGRSTVRQALDIQFPGLTQEEQRYLLGDVAIPGWTPEIDGAVRSHVWIGSDNSFLGLAGLPSTRKWQIGASIGTDDHSEPSLAALQRLWDERTGHVDVRLTDPTWLSNFRVNVRLADNFRRGRVMIAGDAAHVHPPTGGQGMNTGIQDAYNLGWKLAASVRGADETLLDTYGSERRAVAEGVLVTSTDILDVVTSRNPLTRFVMRRLVIPALSRPRFSRALTGRVSQIDVGYRGGPLAVERLRGGRVRAGHRAPDAVLVDGATGKKVRMFDVFRGTHWTLVLVGAAAAQNLDLSGLQATVGHEKLATCLVDGARASSASFRGRQLRDTAGRTFRRAYRARPGTALLVRPDGYIALRAPAPSREIMEYVLDLLGVFAGSASGSSGRHSA